MVVSALRKGLPLIVHLQGFACATATKSVFMIVQHIFEFSGLPS